MLPMASNLLPTKGTTTTQPLAGDKTPIVRTPAHGEIHNFGADHSARPMGHELDHSLRPAHEVAHHHSTHPGGALAPTAPTHGALAPPGHSPLAAPLGHGALAAPLGHGRSPLLLGGRDRSTLGDESDLTRKILSTHAPDIDLDVRPVLAIVEEIMRLAYPSSSDATHATHSAQAGTLGVPSSTHLDKSDHEKTLAKRTPYHEDHDKTLTRHTPYHRHEPDHHGFIASDHDDEIIKILSYPINKISCEIICKCSGGADTHNFTLDLLRLLGSYSWDGKVVITLAAFAINYGEFWLVEHLHNQNPLAKNIATLKDLPETMAHAAELKKRFEAVLELVQVVLKVTHCIISFKQLPHQYITSETPAMKEAMAHIPTAVYWIIRSLLACASTLLSLIGSGQEHVTFTSESWELMSLTHKLSVIMEHLLEKLKICRDWIDGRQGEDAYLAFKKLMASAHIDNMKVLKAMFRPGEDQRPLYNGTTRTNERIEVLRMKYVLLLISDLDLPHEELNVLHLIYNQDGNKRHEYEVLWVPILDPKTAMNQMQENIFYELRNNSMPWFSVDKPSVVEPVAIRYIREEWKFTHRPMLVVLDHHGKPANLDALPMMWIWGSAAFPFTKETERSLWETSQWNISLLADSIDPRITDWIADNKVICLYGGEDIDWIRNFTRATRDVSQALGVPIEMLYVGKRNPKEKVRRCHEIIDREKLSHVFSVKEYYDFVWYFWIRLWSMWNSKKQIGRTIDDDRIMQEIMDVLTFDSSEKGWAVFSRADFDITKGNADRVLPVMENVANWGYLVDHPHKFVPVLDEQLRGVHPEHHCNRLILPGHAGYIPERVVCSECGKIMEKFVMYRCCTD